MTTYLDVFSKKYSLNIKGIVHVGAFDGQELGNYVENGVKNIVMFEPLSQSYSKLEQNLQSLTLDETYDVEIHQVALGNMVGRVDINLSSNMMSSSILKPKLHLVEHPWCAFGGVENVSINKLDSYKYKKFNFLNIDVQGYELEVLKGAKKTLKYIDYIYSEVNKAEVYENNALIDDMDEFLSQYNFIRVETDWCDGASWGDAFYIKKLN